MQNDLNAGMEVVPPMAKAMKSVKEVMVMETPEWLITSAILSSMAMFSTSELFILCCPLHEYKFGLSVSPLSIVSRNVIVTMCKAQCSPGLLKYLIVV